MKKVLLITPEAFGYYRLIIKSFEDLGYIADWLHQIPSENPFVKGFIRLFPTLGEKYSDKYFDYSIDWQTEYETILVIKGEGLSMKMLTKLKEHFYKSKFVFYNWDSFDNSKSALKKLKFFDIVKSFDNRDAENMANVELHPLFHCISVSNEPLKNDGLKYSSFFAGTIHSGRFATISKIAKQVHSYSNKANYLFFFYPSVLIFYIKKLFDKDFRSISRQKVSFEKKSTQELLDKMRNSKVVIDICNTHQNGLTMRTIEAVGLRKKIITNNKSIVKYPFYHSNNVLLVSEMTDSKLKLFLDSEYFEFPNSVYSDLHINRWLQILIENEEQSESPNF